MTKKITAKRLAKLLTDARPWPWIVRKLPPNTTGCRQIVEVQSKRGSHRQAQYGPEIAYTTGDSNDKRDRARAALMALAPELAVLVLGASGVPMKVRDGR